MLFKESVDSAALELLIQLQQSHWLSGFCLVGGTALALKMGHLTSVDIDLFSNFNFDAGQMVENLSANFPFKLLFSANNTIKGSINSIQIDLIAPRYPLIGEPIILEGISM